MFELLTGQMTMGLFCSLIQEPNQAPGRRLIKMDVTTPLDFEVTLYPGHLASESQVFGPNRPTALASSRCQRWYMGPGVRRIPIRVNRVKGTMFIPAGRALYYLVTHGPNFCFYLTNDCACILAYYIFRRYCNF